MEGSSAEAPAAAHQGRAQHPEGALVAAVLAGGWPLVARQSPGHPLQGAQDPPAVQDRWPSPPAWEALLRSTPISWANPAGSSEHHAACTQGSHVLRCAADTTSALVGVPVIKRAKSWRDVQARRRLTWTWGSS